jgi:hypothetical protein
MQIKEIEGVIIMKMSRLMAFALAITVIAVALVVAGCTTTSTPTPTPAPTATPTPAPTVTATPINKTLENMYQLVEHFSAGIDVYNSGVGYADSGKNLINESDFVNASQYYKTAADRMTVASSDFQAMRPYAFTPQEISLSQRWAETADLYAMSYQNASLAYNEYASEQGKQTPNYVKYQYYVQIAQQYNDRAAESRQLAEALADSMTFTVPVAMPVK